MLGFDGIDKEKTRANLASLMGASPAQVQDICALHQGKILSQYTHLLPPFFGSTNRNASGGPLHNDGREDEGFGKGTNHRIWVHNNRDAEAEMQDDMMRMQVDDEIPF